LTERLWAVELAYYWAFTATLQAVLTPDLGQDFPDALYFTYFGYHLGALVGAAFLVWGLGVRLRLGAMWRTFAATLAWACVAGAANVVTGGNYLYLAWKPTHASLLNHMGRGRGTSGPGCWWRSSCWRSSGRPAQRSNGSSTELKLKASADRGDLPRQRHARVELAHNVSRHLFRSQVANSRPDRGQRR
jgi:Integral membrane protein (intg_mem_TP0381)